MQWSSPSNHSVSHRPNACAQGCHEFHRSHTAQCRLEAGPPSEQLPPRAVGMQAAQKLLYCPSFRAGRVTAGVPGHQPREPCLEQGQHLEVGSGHKGWGLFRDRDEAEAVMVTTRLQACSAQRRVCLRGTAVCLLSAWGKQGSQDLEQTRSRWLLRTHQRIRCGRAAKEDWGCSLPAICACQPRAKAAPRRTLPWHTLSFWQAREGGEGGEVQNAILRGIFGVNKFLCSCWSCDWLHQTPLADKIWRAEEYNIKNARVMQSHTHVIALLPAAHPVCHWLHFSYIRQGTYFKETSTLWEASVHMVTYTLH